MYLRVLFRLLTSKSNICFSHLVKSKPPNVIHRFASEIKTLSEKGTKSGFLILSSPWKLCTGVSLGLAARLLLNEGPAYCKAHKNSRVIQRRPNIEDDSAKFDWNRLYDYLKPHKWLLVAAVAVSKLFFCIMYSHKHFVISAIWISHNLATYIITEKLLLVLIYIIINFRLNKLIFIIGIGVSVVNAPYNIISTGFPY